MLAPTFPSMQLESEIPPVGNPDSGKKQHALVLVIDMSSENTQAEIDHAFQFWKNEIVEDPSKWRNGWSVERIRVSLQLFADTYGPAMMDSVKFFGGKIQ
jgi:hypothetical protein